MTERGHHHEAMLSVEEALQRILSFVHVLEPEEKPTLQALGQVLAEDVVSQVNIPPVDNSAMDGYAVRASDLKGAFTDSAVLLRVVGSVAAGEPPKDAVRPGTAIRIMTGAPVPKGADAVVPFEDTDELTRRASGEGISEIGIGVEVEVDASDQHPPGGAGR